MLCYSCLFRNIVIAARDLTVHYVNYINAFHPYPLEMKFHMNIETDSGKSTLSEAITSQVLTTK